MSREVTHLRDGRVAEGVAESLVNDNKTVVYRRSVLLLHRISSSRCRATGVCIRKPGMTSGRRRVRCVLLIGSFGRIVRRRLPRKAFLLILHPALDTTRAATEGAEGAHGWREARGEMGERARGSDILW